MSEILSEACGLRFGFSSDALLLDSIDLEVPRGEVRILAGESGKGKSTLLRLLAGLEAPTADPDGATTGQVFLFGEDIWDVPRSRVRELRRRTGFVFQNSDAQVFSPTVRDELAFGPLQLGLSRAEAADRVADILRLLEIPDLADRAPFQLSGGQKKRVAIGTVLVMNPDVLLFDEPTAGLDPRTGEWLTGLIQELAASGKTIVLATQDLDSLDRLADRCLVFSEEHRIVADGPPLDILGQRQLLLDVNLTHARTRLAAAAPVIGNP